MTFGGSEVEPYELVSLHDYSATGYPRRSESRPENDRLTLLLSERATVRTGSESRPSGCQRTVSRIGTCIGMQRRLALQLYFADLNGGPRVCVIGNVALEPIHNGHERAHESFDRIKRQMSDS